MFLRWIIVILAAPSHGSFTIESDEEMQSDTIRPSLFQDGNPATVDIRARSDDSLSTIFMESQADSPEPDRFLKASESDRLIGRAPNPGILRVVILLILGGALCVALYFGGIIPTNS
jgi:hypothetical protein